MGNSSISYFGVVGNVATAITHILACVYVFHNEILKNMKHTKAMPARNTKLVCVCWQQVFTEKEKKVNKSLLNYSTPTTKLLKLPSIQETFLKRSYLAKESKNLTPT